MPASAATGSARCLWTIPARPLPPKIAAAELKAAQSETDSAGLTQKLADTKAKHIAQIATLEAAHEKDMDWMKNEVRLWRRLAFVLLGIGMVILACLLLYVAWDVLH